VLWNHFYEEAKAVRFAEHHNTKERFVGARKKKGWRENRPGIIFKSMFLVRAFVEVSSVISRRKQQLTRWQSDLGNQNHEYIQTVSS
jgi:hypothetical protein